MSKTNDHNAKTPTAANSSSQAATVAPAASAKGTPRGTETSTSVPLPRSWNDIKVGSLVLAQESHADGWWEAVVSEIRDDILTLRWRDYPRQMAVARNRKAVALLFPEN